MTAQKKTNDLEKEPRHRIRATPSDCQAAQRESDGDDVIVFDKAEETSRTLQGRDHPAV